jgi:outer membrane biosynthesis protein TonB
MSRRPILFSCALHLAVVALFFVHLPFLDRSLPEETPIVVDLVNIAPETRATQKAQTPPVPNKPKEVAQAEPQPEPPKHEPPKPTPPPPSPPPTPPPPTPPPPPQPKPPEPKPPEPKPADKPPPPKPDVKPQPPKPQQKDAATDFDALLKNLAKRPLSDNQAPKLATTAPPPPAASSQPIAPLGAQLSTSEIDVVRQQIEQCWNVPAGARDAQNLVPEFRILMNRDGTVRDAELLNPDQESDPFFQAAAESARRAILNVNCHGPLKFPPDKYDQWQSFTITFNPKDIT